MAAPQQQPSSSSHDPAPTLMASSSKSRSSHAPAPAMASSGSSSKRIRVDKTLLWHTLEEQHAVVARNNQIAPDQRAAARAESKAWGESPHCVSQR